MPTKNGGTAGSPRLCLCCCLKGSYAAYIGMTLSLFFLCSLKKLLFNEKVDDKHNLARHFGMLFLFGGSMVATTVICNLLTGGNTQGRVQDSQALGCKGI